MQTRKRIAVFGRGAHTIPSYRALLNELSKSFDMMVYSEFPIKEKFNACYPIRSVPFESLHRWLIIGWFLLRFGLDHCLLYTTDAADDMQCVDTLGST